MHSFLEKQLKILRIRADTQPEISNSYAQIPQKKVVNASDISISEKNVTFASQPASSKGSKSDVATQPKILKQCALHDKGHNTEDCKQFKALNREERLEALRKCGKCFRCFDNHRRFFL